MIGRNKLDPDQNQFLDQVATTGSRNNYWISGFAGSGKSVLIVAALIQAKKDNTNLNMCVVLYTHSLIDLIRSGIPPDLGHVPVKTFYQFRKDPASYDLILVDEIQDLPPEDIRKMRQQCKQLIMAGDDAQSIYDDRVDPTQLPDIAGAERFPLTIIHRLPRNIVRLAKKIFPGKGLEDAKQDVSATVEPRIVEADTAADEVEYVWDRATRHAEPGEPSAILLPRHSDIVSFVNEVLRQEGASAWSVTKNQWGKNNYHVLNEHLQSVGLKLRYLGNRYGRLKDADNEERVFIMTYHSVKGLDFEAVFIPRLNRRTTIWRDEERARTLFYVAFTRSRRDLYLSYSGTPHPFLSQIPDVGVHKVTVPEPESEASTDDPFDEIVF